MSNVNISNEEFWVGVLIAENGITVREHSKALSIKEAIDWCSNILNSRAEYKKAFLMKAVEAVERETSPVKIYPCVSKEDKKLTDPSTHPSEEQPLPLPRHLEDRDIVF
jgi:hypothetical protein